MGNEETFRIMGLFVGTIVTLSLYILSNSAVSVAAVPVIPQSLGNCTREKIITRYLRHKDHYKISSK